MKVVFKVCCAPDSDQQNTTTSISNSGHQNINNNNNNNNQGQQNKNVNNNNQHGYNNGNRGVSINTNIDGQSSNGGRAPPVLINTSNNVTSNVVQSTMSWPSWGSGNNNDGNYLHSTPLTSTLSVQQYYPHHTSPRPIINSAINNNNYNSNSNHSNYAPSHKPTKKTSNKKNVIYLKCARRRAYAHYSTINFIINYFLIIY